MVNPKEIHEKIIEAIKSKGPSLPIQLAKQLNMSSLFISAFLSELANEKKIKISSLKVGGSPLYFVEGQQEKLESYYNYLPQKEAETFLLLKEKKVLKDSEQEPAIRVALRSIRDFASGFRINDEIYWRYMLVSESGVREMLQPKKIGQKQEIKSEEKEITSKDETIAKPPQHPQLLQPITVTKKPKHIADKEEKTKNEFQNPLAIKPKEKPKPEKPKSKFIEKTIEFLKNNNIKLIEEKDYKAKEYNCMIQINSQLGPIKFLAQAKDKKTISESDLKKFLSTAQSIPLPAFLLFTGELSKKAQEYLRTYNSILKARKIE